MVVSIIVFGLIGLLASNAHAFLFPLPDLLAPVKAVLSLPNLLFGHGHGYATGSPHGCQKIGNKCYIYVENAVDWQTAKANCKILGGKLATIDSETENKFVSGLIKHESWIGLNDIIHEKTMVWTDTNKKPTYFNWAGLEPNNAEWFGKTEDCVLMYSWGFGKGQWNDNFCDRWKDYVCELAPGASGNGPCPANSKSFGKKCYQFVDSKLNWQDARGHCQSLHSGGKLATIDSDNENNFVYGLLGGKDSWIGLNDRQTENHFEWSDRSGQPVYTHWARGEPNNAWWSEDCVVLVDPNWNDDNCGNKRTFACEFPSKPIVLPTPAPTKAPASRCRWTTYRNQYVAMNNAKEVTVKSVAECKKLCEKETDFTCNSLDYQISKKRCNLASISYAQAKKQDLLRTNSDFILYAC